MEKDPYAPPESAVRDVLPERLLTVRPPQVARAAFLLWITYGLAFPMMAVEAERLPGGITGGVLVVWAIMLAIGAVLNIGIWRGANWSRIAYLALFLPTFVSFWGSASELLQRSVYEFILNCLNSGLDAVAMYLVFSRPGALWYRKAAS